MGGSPQTNGRLQGYIPGIMKWQFFWVGAEKARLFIGRTARAAAVLHEALKKLEAPAGPPKHFQAILGL